MAGSSITHYLIHLVNFILGNLDSKEATAILAAIVDFAKAFNRQSHNRLIVIMHELGIPGWLLKLVASYLTNRTMVVNYNGHTSSEKDMNAGSPQGTLLGVLLFILQVTGLRTFPKVPAPEIIVPPAVKQPNTSCKYIDDFTAASVIKLKPNLMRSDDIVKPVVYHSRTGHVLPDDKNPLAKQVKNVQNFAVDNFMKLNTKKTNIMLFTRAKKYDFQPELYIDNDLLNVVEVTKLLGVMISSDLKWKENVQYIVSRCMKRLWMLRRIRELGGSSGDLLTVYKLQIRCLAELACPVWNGALTINDSLRLERIQKNAARIILGQNYLTYENALSILNIPKLSDRRKDLCLKFALKASKNNKYSAWFQETIKKTKTSQKYKLPYVRTTAYQKSPLIYLAKLLNEHTLKTNPS